MRFRHLRYAKTHSMAETAFANASPLFLRSSLQSRTIDIDASRNVHLCAPNRKPIHCTVVRNTAASSDVNKVTTAGKKTPPPLFYTFDPIDIEAIRIRHVLVRSEELAGSVYDMVRKKQATLAELAPKLSICDSSRENGGDLGWWWCDEKITDESSKLGMHEALFGAALRTDANQLARIKSSAGEHIFAVEDVRHRLRPTHTTPRRSSRRKVASPVITPEPMTYVVQTLGCQMNRSDSERMAGELERVGYREATDPGRAAVVVLNTCSIRDHAEGKVYSYLGRHAQRKRATPGDVTLCVAGCVAQQEGERLLRRVPELDLVIGPHYANRLGDLLEDVRTNQVQVAATEPIFIQEDISKPRRQSSVTSWVNVIYGCNERCTYCVVPHVRGLEQSRPMEAIRGEIEEIAKTSVREVVLLGQNVDAYGRDMYPKRTFADLLEVVHSVEGIDRIRFTTSHPRYMTPRLIATCARLPKVMPSFHIPPQAGDNEVLRRMKRGYTIERFFNIVDRIREAIPHASIAGDAIVGFPGETEAQFQNTLRMMERVQFDTLHTAAYSPRPNTDAAVYEDQVPDAVKMDRLARINDLVTRHAHICSKRYVGGVEQVLVESSNAKKEGEVLGRNPTNRVVVFPGDIEQLRGKIVPVRIENATPFTIVGVQCGDPY